MIVMSACVLMSIHYNIYVEITVFSITPIIKH